MKRRMAGITVWRVRYKIACHAYFSLRMLGLDVTRSVLTPTCLLYSSPKGGRLHLITYWAESMVFPQPLSIRIPPLPTTAHVSNDMLPNGWSWKLTRVDVRMERIHDISVHFYFLFFLQNHILDYQAQNISIEVKFKRLEIVWKDTPKKNPIYCRKSKTNIWFCAGGSQITNEIYDM